MPQKFARQIFTFKSGGADYRFTRLADDSFSIEKKSIDSMNKPAWAEVGNVKPTTFDVNRMASTVLFDCFDQYVRVELAAKSKV